MSESDFYTPTDTDKLRMENDLLTLQARFLKAQLAASTPHEPIDSETISQLQEAERDLIYLMRRLSRPPLGWIMRLRPGFRVLQNRYL